MDSQTNRKVSGVRDISSQQTRTGCTLSNKSTTTTIESVKPASSDKDCKEKSREASVRLAVEQRKLELERQIEGEC